MVEDINSLLGFDSVLILIFVCMLFLDFTTGLLKARGTNTYSSKYTFKGVCRKCGELFLIVAAVLTQFVLNALKIPLEINMPIGQGMISINLPGIVIVFLLVYELGSILENLEALGVPVPGIFKKKVIEIKEDLKQEKE